MGPHSLRISANCPYRWTFPSSFSFPCVHHSSLLSATVWSLRLEDHRMGKHDHMPAILVSPYQSKPSNVHETDFLVFGIIIYFKFPVHKVPISTFFFHFCSSCQCRCHLRLTTPYSSTGVHQKVAKPTLAQKPCGTNCWNVSTSLLERAAIPNKERKKEVLEV